eukprot:TRINITY_DN60480_c0_g1_i1.p1 TRINITY_DN60480_c0_g1~~TRINITY_DN60480_c0_g1_i1.p1  ORF type:complete len:1024 (+),score=276.75 TRINITY_DN60480_c0_g1_i1:63-3074(+)
MPDGKDDAAEAKTVSETPAEVRSPAETAVELKRGDLVTIEGLKASELNGLQASLFQWGGETGRWEVKLPDGEVKAIRPANLVFRGIGPLEDDGSLTLIGMASDHTTLQKALGNLSDQQQPASEALALLGSVISPSGGLRAQGEETRIWLKLAKQAEQRVRAALEEFQKNMEMVDGIDTSRLGPKASGELKLARRDLINFVQKSQEQLEAALTRLRPVLQRLSKTVPTKRQGWSEPEQSLHEKYREAFEKMEDGAAVSSSKKTRLGSIVVKYQGSGANPPPSDNLYVKGLPGWVEESDIEAMFSQVGVVQSMKLKTADWGAIAFVRLANRKEAAAAIEKFNLTVPEVLEKRAEEQEAEQLEMEIAQAGLRATIDQLARGVIVIVDLRKPLGIIFDDHLKAKNVQESAQAFELGVKRDWRVRSIGGVDLAGTEELKERIQKLKSEGLKQASVVFTPPPVVASFLERPMGLTVAKHEELGLVYVTESSGAAQRQGIRRGAIVANIGGKDVSSSTVEEVTELFREAELPVSIVFEQQVQVSAANIAAVAAADNSAENLSEDEGGNAPARDEAMAQSLPPVDLEVDLSLPLGIVFDDDLGVKSVKFNSQAARLGIAAGWKALRLAGEELESTSQLLEKVQALKSEGSLSQSLTFQPKAGSIMSAAHTVQAAAAALRDRAAEAVAEAAEQEARTTRKVELELDLSQPLGILFNKFLTAESVQADSQGAKLGISAGWRALSLGGEEFSKTQDLVAKIQALKKDGTLSVKAVFSAPILDLPMAKAPEASVSAAPVAAAPVSAADEQAPPQGVTVELTLDLTQPLAIGFSDSLVAKDVKEDGQGARLGVGQGWRLVSLLGQQLNQTKDLVARIKGLKADGVVSATSSWSAPEGTAPVAAPAEVRGQEPEAEPEIKVDNLVELQVDLKAPLGIGFTDDLVAKEIKPSSQAEKLGVCSGWRVRSVSGEALATTKELVAKFGALKKGGAASVSVCFLVGGGENSAEPSPKRQRTE